MPKTIKQIFIQFQHLLDVFFRAKTEDDIHNLKERIKLLREMKWFSEQELKDKLKKAEKRIKKLCSTEESSVILMSHKQTERAILKILNDCFGDGK